MSRTLWIAFSLFVLYAATLPFQFTGDVDAVARKWSRVSWNPVVSPLTGGRIPITDTVQNVMLFVPFGALGVLALRRSMRSIAARVGLVTAAGMTLSVVVEALQLFTIERTTSTADLVTNTAGAALGAVGGELGLRLLRAQLPRAQRLVRDPGAFYVVVVAAVVLLVSAWQPFDFRLDVGHLGGVAKQLLRDPWQLAGFRDEAAAFLQYGLFGAALSYWLAREGATRAAAIAAAVGVVTAIGLEASQLIVDSRMPAGTDLVVRLAGALAGVGVWRVWPAASSSWVAVVIAGTAAAAAMQMWSPYEFAETRRPFSWLPFLPYYESNWFPILSHSIELMLLYFPIGFVIGLVSSSPRQAALAAGVASLAVCIPVEYVQSWIVTRYASVTDLVMSTAGGIAGAWAATRGAQAFNAVWNDVSSS